MEIIATLQNVSARYQISLNLNNSTFILDFYWSTREGAWYFDIADVNSVSLVSGIKIVPNIFLLRQFGTVRQLIGGDFILVDQESNSRTSNLNYDSFGVRYFFEYLTTEEIGTA